MSNDMSDIFKMFSGMMNGQEVPESVKNILNNMNNNNSENNSTSNSENIFDNIDMDTIVKLQKAMNSINNDSQADSRTNLLMSLKPYLKESRRGKVDQYVKLMKMGKVFEIMNPLGGDTKNV